MINKIYDLYDLDLYGEKFFIWKRANTMLKTLAERIKEEILIQEEILIFQGLFESISN